MAQNNKQWNEEQQLLHNKTFLVSTPTGAEELSYAKSKRVITKVKRSYKNISAPFNMSEQKDFSNSSTQTNNELGLEELLNSSTYYSHPFDQNPIELLSKKNTSKTKIASLKNRDWTNFTESEFALLKEEFENTKRKFTRSAKKFFYPEPIHAHTTISLGEQELFIIDIFREGSIEFILTCDASKKSQYDSFKKQTPKEKAEQINSYDFMQVMQTFIPPVYDTSSKKTTPPDFNSSNHIIFARIGDYLCITQNNQAIKLLLNHFLSKALQTGHDPIYQKGHFINFFPREK